MTPPLLPLGATSLSPLLRNAGRLSPLLPTPALHTPLDHSAQGTSLGWLSHGIDHLHHDFEGLQSSGIEVAVIHTSETVEMNMTCRADFA